MINSSQTIVNNVFFQYKSSLLIKKKLFLSDIKVAVNKKENWLIVRCGFRVDLGDARDNKIV